MTRRRGLGAVAVPLIAVAFVAAACGGSGGNGGGGSFDGAALTGAGATVPDPIYELWFSDFKKVESGAKINYQAIGSGGGVTQFTAQTVDFGASDAPLKDEEIAAITAKNGDVVEVPTVLGGVVVAYNVSGLRSGLKLDGATVANIFLGRITTWNDPAIAGQNSGVTLPDTSIQVAHRSDESGTTKVFTSWLSAGSPDWESQVGADKAVEWPVGVGGDGNDGVAAAISQTDGSIGYLSFDFAVTSNLGVADIKRTDGTYVTPSVDSISAAGGDLKFPITADTNILNSSSTGAYPISTTTYLLVPKELNVLKDKDKAQTLVDLLTWCLTKGQSEVQQLNYSPLPSSIATEAMQLVSQLTFGGSALPATSGIGS
jgi:phosphate transport system substrate-binding protein